MAFGVMYLTWTVIASVRAYLFGYTQNFVDGLADAKRKSQSNNWAASIFFISYPLVWLVYTPIKKPWIGIGLSLISMLQAVYLC